MGRGNGTEKMKRPIAFIIGLMMLLMVGCGEEEQPQTTQPEPTTVEEAAEEHVDVIGECIDTANSIETFHIDMDMDTDIESGAGSAKTRLVLEADSGERLSHAVASGGYSIETGEYSDEPVEIYSDADTNTLYLKANGKWEEENNSLHLKRLLTGVGNDSYAQVAEGDDYTVAMDAIRIRDNLMDSEILLFGILKNGFTRAIEVTGGTVSYEIDRETMRIKEIGFNGVTLEEPGARCIMNGSISFGGYNELSDEDYKVPKKVKESVSGVQDEEETIPKKMHHLTWDELQNGLAEEEE